MTVDVQSVVTEALLAPTVHNTQPTLWTFDRDGLILTLDPPRRLAVGDPEGRDAAVSLGAALRGTEIALSRQGVGCAIERNGTTVRLAFRGEASPAWPIGVVKARRTWRGGFLAGIGRLPRRDDAAVVEDAAEIGWLADLNDRVSLDVLRDPAFRDELRSWMRLSRRHPEWSRDGLNAEALDMGRVESMAAGVVLRRRVFEVFDRMGLGRAVTGEAGKTRSSQAVIGFHRPEGEDPVDSGRAFLDLWLECAEGGLAAWPMAALADVPEARAEVSRRIGIPGGRRLMTMLRVGPAPMGPPKARLPVGEVLRR